MRLDFSILGLYVIIKAQLYLQVPISLENNGFTLLTDTKVDDYHKSKEICTMCNAIVTEFLINQECIITNTYVYVRRISFFSHVPEILYCSLLNVSMHRIQIQTNKKI